MSSRLQQLCRACQAGDPGTVQHIISAPGGRNEIDRLYGGQTALHFAAGSGNWLPAKLLLDAQADPNTQDGEGQTPVMLAAAAGHEGVLRVLGKTGRCNVNLRRNDGQDAMLLATYAGHASMLIRHVPTEMILEQPIERALSEDDLFGTATPQAAARSYIEREMMRATSTEATPRAAVSSGFGRARA